MIVRRVHPGAVDSIDLDDPGARERLLELYRPPTARWLRLNLVTSVSGSAAGSDGTSETLTSKADRRILGVIRELSDVVLVGAESVRTEGYVRPKHAPLAVVTGSGDLAGHRIGGEGPPTLVLCPASAIERVAQTLPDADIMTLPGQHLSPTHIISGLRGHGFESIVCEGGPGLAGQFVVAGLVDEVCLTTSPRLTAVTLPLFGAEAFPEIAVTLGQMLIDDESSIYSRWFTTAGSTSA